MNEVEGSESPLNTVYLVMNIFVTIFPPDFPTRLATASSSATSEEDRRHPVEPKLLSTWAKDFAPGIGIVPLHIHQLIATWEGVFFFPSAMMAINELSSSILGRIDRNKRPLGPCGSVLAL